MSGYRFLDKSVPRPIRKILWRWDCYKRKWRTRKHRAICRWFYYTQQRPREKEQRWDSRIGRD